MNRLKVLCIHVCFMRNHTTLSFVCLIAKTLGRKLFGWMCSDGFLLHFCFNVKVCDRTEVICLNFFFRDGLHISEVRFTTLALGDVAA